jgi:hypothetical protein
MSTLLATYFHAGILLTMNMEVTCSSETSVAFQRTTRHYIPEDRTLHNHRYENHKSYNNIQVRKHQTEHEIPVRSLSYCCRYQKKSPFKIILRTGRPSKSALRIKYAPSPKILFQEYFMPLYGSTALVDLGRSYSQ